MFVNPNLNYQPLGFAPSQFSPGGTYSMAPSYQYINPYYQQAQQQVQQQQSGPNLLDMASSAKSIISPNNSAGGSGIFGNINSAINNFGSSLGFASGNVMYPASTFGAIGPQLPGAASGLIGPVAPGMAGTPVAGSLGTTSTLGGILGGAGFGAFAGGFLGRIGGNPTGGMIGGALGGALGAATGLSSGIAMGSTLGSIVPGLGTVIGAGLGGLIGGFFGGGKPATSADTYGALINKDGTINYAAGGATGKNAGSYAGFGRTNVDQFGKMAQEAGKALGIQWNDTQQVNAGISTRHGGAYFDFGLPNEGPRERFWFDQTNQQSAQDAAVGMLKALAKKSGYEDMEAIDKWVAQRTSGNSASSSNYIVPFKTQERFDDFMSKFKSQDTVNASTTTTTNTAA
jgi:hypothetical protein